MVFGRVWACWDSRDKIAAKLAGLSRRAVLPIPKAVASPQGHQVRQSMIVAHFLSPGRGGRIVAGGGVTLMGLGQNDALPGIALHSPQASLLRDISIGTRLPFPPPYSTRYAHPSPGNPCYHGQFHLSFPIDFLLGYLPDRRYE